MTRKAEVGENTEDGQRKARNVSVELEQFGKEWKDISQLIPTRSVVRFELTLKILSESGKSHQKKVFLVTHARKHMFNCIGGILMELEKKANV